MLVKECFRSASCSVAKICYRCIKMFFDLPQIGVMDVGTKSVSPFLEWEERAYVKRARKKDFFFFSMIFSSENIFFLSQLCHQDSNSSYLALAARFVLNCFTALRSLIFNSGLLRYHIFHVNCLCIWKDAKTSSRVYTRLKLSIWGWNWPVLYLTHSPRIYVCIPLVTSLTLPKMLHNTISYVRVRLWYYV